MKTYRRQIREKILQALYTIEIRDTDIDSAAGWLLTEEILADGNAMKFFNTLLKNIKEHMEEIDRFIFIALDAIARKLWLTKHLIVQSIK